MSRASQLRTLLPAGVRSHRNKFTATIRVNKKLYKLGVFKTAEEASNAYQTALNDLNNIEKYVVLQLPRSKFGTGVYQGKNKKSFDVKLKVDGKIKHLGSFKDLEKAQEFVRNYKCQMS